MQTDKRQRGIYEIAVKQSMVRISNLAKHYNVSIETIRRDINTLEEKGLLKKVHGGAVINKNSLDSESDFNIRLHENLAEKDCMGEYAAKLIRSNEVIALDCGVTILSVARALYDLENLTVVTNSLAVAQIICDKLSRRSISGKLILLGGTVTPSEYCVLDAVALHQLEPFRFDKFFTSATSVSDDGVFVADVNSALMTQFCIKNATETIILANHQKFKNPSHYRLASFNDVNRLIVDRLEGIDQKILDAIYASKCELDVCGKTAQ